MRKWWSNPVLREWVIRNMEQDSIEEDNKLRLMILAQNPALYKELESPKNLTTLETAVNKRIKQIKNQKVDEKFLKSKEKYEKLKMGEDEFSLTGEGMIDVSSDECEEE